MARRTINAKRDGASQSRARWRDQLGAWQRHHQLSAADSLRRVLEQPWSSLLTWLVIGIALALPVGLSVALDNAQFVSADWQSPAQISLFLEPLVSQVEAVELEANLAKYPGIGETTLVTKDDALIEFKSMSGFSDVLAALEENPLPHLIIVSPVAQSSPESVLALQQALLSMPQIAQAILDMQWLQRLNSAMVLGQRLVLAVGGMLVLGVALILGNTIRLSIENRREEIIIVKLVGGSDAFVRRPFLYTGLWHGVGGGILAAIIVGSALWFLDEPSRNLAALYQSGFRLQGLGLMGGLNLIVLGGLLGLFGAALAVSSQLGRIQPR
ncbi:MAG: cell division transport system permease protein [Halioglobus sp.]|jgi:cell division transport system permease protein